MAHLISNRSVEYHPKSTRTFFQQKSSRSSSESLSRNREPEHLEGQYERLPRFLSAGLNLPAVLYKLDSYLFDTLVHLQTISADKIKIDKIFLGEESTEAPPVSVTRWKEKSSGQISAGSGEQFLPSGDERGTAFTQRGRHRGRWSGSLRQGVEMLVE